MNRTISNIERAAAARERMNHQCRTTEFRKFGAQMRYETGAFDTLTPSPCDVQPADCAEPEERRRLKAAVARLREAMYEWTCLCEEHFGLSPAFDDAAWEAIEQQLNTPKDKQMDAKEILKMMAESGGIRVAGDFVMEKHVQYEVANVENGGIGIMVAGEGQQPKPTLTDDEQAIVAELKVCFWGDEEQATRFYNAIKGGMKNAEITAMVNRLVEERIVSEGSCHRDLWTILHNHGLYTASESNWNMQVKATAK